MYLLYQWSVLYPFSTLAYILRTWPMYLLYPWSTHRPIDLLYQWSILYHFSTLAYILPTWPMYLLYPWSTHRPIDLLHQWSVLDHCSTLAYILPTWPMDLLYPWSTHRPIDLLCQWSDLYPFITLVQLHPPHLTNGHGRRSREGHAPNIFDGPMLKPLNNYCWLCAFSLCPPRNLDEKSPPLPMNLIYPCQPTDPIHLCQSSTLTYILWTIVFWA